MAISSNAEGQKTSFSLKANLRIPKLNPVGIRRHFDIQWTLIKSPDFI